MSEFSFFWHDYETFGRVPRRDRPSQFAGVRTDAELNEIEAPVMLYCQPAPDFLPDPEACLLTGILPQTALEKGLPEHQFSAAIEAVLAAPGTVGVGYNSIRFDDEVTRHLFWRSLTDPYAREWQNSCGRWDILDVVRCAYALRPQGIQWPTHEDGRPSFKLEHLTVANGLVHEAAHDALSDVRATVALARLLKSAQPKLFDFCLKLHKKDAVWSEIGVGRPFLHVSGMYGPERGCIALVWPLAPHPSNKNELVVWDCSVDPTELLGLNAEQIRSRLFVKQDELPEGVTRLPIKSVHVNKSPIVIGNLKTLTPVMAEKWAIDIEQGLVHAQLLAQNGRLLDGLWGDVFKREKVATAIDVDEDLYGGFISPDDRRALQRVLSARPEQLTQRAEEGKLVFADRRLDELVFRFRARNYPASLSEAEQQRWAAHCSARLHQGSGGSQTLAGFFEKLDQLNEVADDRGQEILAALYDYAEQIAPPG